jgi:PAS domain S-box-containing protein
MTRQIAAARASADDRRSGDIPAGPGLDTGPALDAVLDQVGDGVHIELNGVFTLNAAGRRLLGINGNVDPSKPAGTPVEVYDLDGRALTEDEYPLAQAKRLRRPVPYVIQVRRRDGELRVFEGTAAPILEGGELRGSVSTFRDVTDDYHRRRLTEQLLEQLFEALPVAVLVTHPESGEIFSANRAFGELVGLAPRDIVGATAPFPWESDVPEIDFGCCAGPDGCLASVDALFRREDGRLVPVELTPLLVRGDGGEPVAAVRLVTDLSERRRFEQQIVQSGKLAAIGELAAGVAHEINNPLFAILGLVEFLLKESEPGTKAYDRLTLIQQTGLEIKDVVRALLDFARERSDEFELVSLHDVVSQTIDLVRRTTLRKEIEIVETYPAEPLYVLASAGQLKQIFLNLVTNAQQAMADGGSITFALERDGHSGVVQVTDTGPGIPKDVIDRIFDPFFTTKRELGGTGLGLALSQSIAVSHGGSLVAYSPPGAGAEFTLRLPLAEERR